MIAASPQFSLGGLPNQLPSTAALCIGRGFLLSAGVAGHRPQLLLSRRSVIPFLFPHGDQGLPEARAEESAGPPSKCVGFLASSARPRDTSGKASRGCWKRLRLPGCAVSGGGRGGSRSCHSSRSDGRLAASRTRAPSSTYRCSARGVPGVRRGGGRRRAGYGHTSTRARAWS
jgi:hypothetical protein